MRGMDGRMEGWVLGLLSVQGLFEIINLRFKDLNIELFRDIYLRY